MIPSADLDVGLSSGRPSPSQQFFCVDLPWPENFSGSTIRCRLAKWPMVLAADNGYAPGNDWLLKPAANRGARFAGWMWVLLTRMSCSALLLI